MIRDESRCAIIDCTFNAVKTRNLWFLYIRTRGILWFQIINRSIKYANKKCICTFESLWLLAVVLQKTCTHHASNIHHYPQSIPWKTLRFQKNMFTQFWGAWFATFFFVICNAHFYLHQTESMLISRINFIRFIFITFVNIVTTTTRFGCAEN